MESLGLVNFPNLRSTITNLVSIHRAQLGLQNCENRIEIGQISMEKKFIKDLTFHNYFSRVLKHDR